LVDCTERRHGKRSRTTKNTDEIKATHAQNPFLPTQPEANNRHL
jgi:hypothetical protein